MNRHMIALSAGVAAAGLFGSGMPGQAADPRNRPALVEVVSGSPVKRITLTERAAQRLDIGIAAVASGGQGAIVVPYAAIIYDKAGATWVYTTSQDRVFMRHAVRIARISGEDAVLAAGPVAGTRIVIVGVPELYGAELGIGQ